MLMDRSGKYVERGRCGRTSFATFDMIPLYMHRFPWFFMRVPFGILLIGTTSLSKAQFVVTDPGMVEALQYWVPAAMNGNVLDTLHPDVLSTTSLTLNIGNTPVLNADGVQFFDSLISLNASFCQVQQLPTLPSGLHFLGVEYAQLSALPPLPSGLLTLNCSHNQLTTLPPLPQTLISLYCDNNQLSALPALPPPLYQLFCQNNALTALPDLPDALLALKCQNNLLTALPLLPDSLGWIQCEYNALTGLPPLPANAPDLTLNCHYNAIIQLPPLPSGTYYLNCSNNAISALPELPEGLSVLSCGNNPITELPALPQSLYALWCQTTLLTSLPELPDSLNNIQCFETSIGCLPWLPNTLASIRCYSTAVSCLPNIPTNFNAGNSILGFPLHVCNLNTAPCPIDHEAVSGSVFIDANANGVKELGEAPFRYSIITAQPGDFLTASGPDGRFAMPLEAGSYTVDGEAMPYHTRTNPPYSITLGPLEVDSLLDIGYWPMPGVHDLQVDVTSFFPRPGFEHNAWLRVKNIGTEPEEAVVDLTFGTDQQWVESTEPPSALDAATAQWSVFIPPGGEWLNTVTLFTPYGTPENTPVPYTLAAWESEADTTPANNTMVFDQVVLHSCDPNDKRVSPATLSPAEVALGDPLEYIIRFQNTGTYQAERVVITDTLSSLLDPGSVRFVSSSHDCHWFLHQGVLHVVFDPIVLPDSTADEPNSHGFVKFLITPFPGLESGDEIANVANIYFDFNDPVVTAPAVFTVQLPMAVFSTANVAPVRIYPDPATSEVHVEAADGIRRIRLIAPDGRVLLDKFGAAPSILLDLSGLPRGVVLAHVTTATGSAVQRIVLH